MMADIADVFKNQQLMLSDSKSSLLKRLAVAGADSSITPGQEIVRIEANSAEAAEALRWQSASILRRDTDRPMEKGIMFYTWNHASLRLSASRAFGTKWRPLVFLYSV